MADPTVYSADLERTLDAIRSEAMNLRARIKGLPESTERSLMLGKVDDITRALATLRERNRNGADPDVGRWAGQEWD